MAYSNVIPPALPENDYQYQIIQFNYGIGEEDWHQLRLVVSTAPFKAAYTSIEDWDGNVLISGGAAQNTGPIRVWVCGTDGAWEELDITEVSVVPGGFGDVYTRLWTSHDIPDEEGNVWLAAGEVTPIEEIVSEIWPRSFKMGLAVGLTGKPLPFVQREPVGWLYRGHLLPKIPEVVEYDGEVYSYRLIHRDPPEDTVEYSENYTLTCFKAFPSIINRDVYRHLIYIKNLKGDAVQLRLNADRTAWGEITPISSNTTEVPLTYAVWASFSMYSDKFEVRIVAEEPVPMYEQEGPNG